VSGDEIRVQVSFKDVADIETMLLRCFDVLIDVALRIDDCRLTVRANHV
jgi:hypothetical protein